MLPHLWLLGGERAVDDMFDEVEVILGDRVGVATEAHLEQDEADTPHVRGERIVLTW